MLSWRRQGCLRYAVTPQEHRPVSHLGPQDKGMLLGGPEGARLEAIAPAGRDTCATRADSGAADSGRPRLVHPESR